jgi:uncharacterized protein YcaQ
VERAGSGDVIRVVSEICGLHAQLMSSAELSLWARIDGLPRDVVSEALWQDRTLVKLWAMRGTLHLLPSAELGMWLAALGTQSKHGNTGHPEIDALSDAVGRALDGRMLTREELALEVERITGEQEYGEWVRFSWGSYLKAAAFRGLICFAPSAGSNVRFTTAATQVPGSRDRPDPQEALREVTRRFLRAYGPLTGAELALWWGGYGPGRGTRMIAALGEEAAEVQVEGQRAWALAKDVPAMVAAEPPDVARLLPAFDPWVIGASRNNASLFDPQHKPRIHRPQGWVSPVILVNGQVAGIWKHARKGRRLLIEIEPFDRLPAWATPQIAAEAERLATFLDGDLALTGL